MNEGARLQQELKQLQETCLHERARCVYLGIDTAGVACSRCNKVLYSRPGTFPFTQEEIDNFPAFLQPVKPRLEP